MNVNEKLIETLRQTVSTSKDRVATLRAIADLLRSSGGYRWVAFYDVDHAAGIVKNIIWSGPAAPEYPAFPITKGLTGSAIATRKTVNAGDVSADPRYLTALGSTQSEIIVPVFDSTSETVVGTIDVESGKRDAFSEDVQQLLEACAKTIRPLWQD